MAKSMFLYTHSLLTRWSCRTSWRGRHFNQYGLQWWTQERAGRMCTATCGNHRHILRFWGHVEGLLLRQLCWNQGSWERGTCVKHFYCWANQPWLTMQICREMNGYSWAWKTHWTCKCFHHVNTSWDWHLKKSRLTPETLLMCSLWKWEFSMRLS